MKKIYIKNLVLSLILLFGLTGCFDLEKFPEGQLSTVNALSSNAEMEKYLNQFYESAVKGHPTNVANASGIAFGDQQSDNMVNAAPTNRLAGLVTLSNASRLGDYNNIRNLNFMIENFKNNREEGPDKRQFMGEAYYFRAWYYFQMVKNYGDVTWVSKVLDIAAFIFFTIAFNPIFL